MRSGGTISIMFTDIVGSTDLLARLGDSEWDTVRRVHFTALRDVLAEHAGTEIKNTGDGGDGCVRERHRRDRVLDRHAATCPA